MFTLICLSSCSVRCFLSVLLIPCILYSSYWHTGLVLRIVACHSSYWHTRSVLLILCMAPIQYWHTGSVLLIPYMSQFLLAYRSVLRIPCMPQFLLAYSISLADSMHATVPIGILDQSCWFRECHSSYWHTGSVLLIPCIPQFLLACTIELGFQSVKNSGNWALL